MRYVFFFDLLFFNILGFNFQSLMIKLNSGIYKKNFGGYKKLTLKIFVKYQIKKFMVPTNQAKYMNV